jgi:hypothetical protein
MVVEVVVGRRYNHRIQQTYGGVMKRREGGREGGRDGKSCEEGDLGSGHGLGLGVAKALWGRLSLQY